MPDVSEVAVGLEGFRAESNGSFVVTDRRGRPDERGATRRSFSGTWDASRSGLSLVKGPG